MHFRILGDDTIAVFLSHFDRGFRHSRSGFPLVFLIILIMFDPVSAKAWNSLSAWSSPVIIDKGRGQNRPLRAYLFSGLAKAEFSSNIGDIWKERRCCTGKPTGCLSVPAFRRWHLEMGGEYGWISAEIVTKS
jgi:hypothetical protein